VPATIDFDCPHCRTRLSFAPAQAGASGPCFACSKTIVVPSPQPSTPPPARQSIAPTVPMSAVGPVIVVCPGCSTPAQFPIEMLGQSGPCRTCGRTFTVVLGAQGLSPAPTQSMPPAAPASVRPPAMAPSVPPPSSAPGARGPSNPQLSVPPSALHQKIAQAVAREGAKNGMQMLGMRVIQLGQKVGAGENFGAALWGGSIRVDQAQAIKMRSPRGDFFVFIPWSGSMTLAHEFASVIPRGLPSCLCLSRGLMGSWSTGRYEGSNGGERDPIAIAAEADHTINDGISWDWESGRMRIKLHWGLQAVPFDTTPEGPRTLHVVHTAEIGILFREYGLRWYLDRQLAFARFVQAQGYTGPPPRRVWNPAPLAALFIDDFYL
jgi:hypothetical protein